MTAHLVRWIVALGLATLVMGLALAHAAYAKEPNGCGVVTGFTAAIIGDPSTLSM